MRTTRNYVHGHRYGGTHSKNTLNALHGMCENEDEELRNGTGQKGISHPNQILTHCNVYGQFFPHFLPNK